MHTWLVAQAWCEFLYTDLIGLIGFSAIRNVVRRVPRPTSTDTSALTTIIDATRTAGAFYIKSTKCLQHAAVVTRLLRRHGVAADLVIGCHPAMMRGHAWVEVDGTVVSERLVGLEYYRVLDRW